MQPQGQAMFQEPPPPAYPAEEAEDYGRYLWACFRTPSPINPLPDHVPNPGRTHFENAQTQIRALILEQALRHPGNASPIWVNSPVCEAPLVLHTAGPVRIGTPANLAAYPDEDNNSDSSDYRGNEPVPEREDDDPLNAHGGDYEWPELGAIDRVILGPYRSQAWELRWLDIEQQSPFLTPDERVPMGYYLAITKIERSAPPPLGTRYQMLIPELRPNNANWSTTYSHWPLQRETVLTWMAPPESFDTFNYDEGTFGGYATELPRDYGGYTPAPHQSFYTAPFPLPDSPNWEYQHPVPHQTHPCRIQRYRPPQYGTTPFAGQDPLDPDDQQAGGSNDPPQPTREEKLEKARLQSMINQNEYNLLKAQLEAAQDKMMGHNMIWDLNQPPNDNKGKKPERGRPFVPNYRRPLHEREDQFSVPRPLPGKGRPNPMPQPIGQAPPDAAYLGIKPILMQPPKPFKGVHDDIKRFIGDCITYFEAFAAYFLLDSQTIPFAASYFERPAKEWWVYKHPEFWANDDDDPISARFRYPTWPEFVAILTAQFRDPAVEIVHERKMFEFFYELEKEAKLAGHRNDKGERGTLIAAVRRGLLESYTSMIANIGRDIPQTYSEWKTCVLVMYDERQKNYAFDQHLNHRDNQQPFKGPATTTTNNNKAGGATSSSPAKLMSSTAPSGDHDAGGRWLACPGTTFGGVGAPMDIGRGHVNDGGRLWPPPEPVVTAEQTLSFSDVVPTDKAGSEGSSMLNVSIPVLITKRMKVCNIIAFIHYKKYIPGIPHFFSYGFYVPEQHIPASEFQTMRELGVRPLMHLHFIVGLLGGADDWEQCACNSDGTLKQASEIEWFNDPDNDVPTTGPSGSVGHELHGCGLCNKSNAKFSAYIAAEKLNEEGNPAALPKPHKH
ncbi:uncharacterized protein ARMOST_00566 [Armillaria ostoyae]|uniref:Uncharacterized protein n=1 Tax=Armillaria ostoyae TaxID=47428 RepID=A0A284QLH7_ARMOS|nr:uncharacterized protein ARMOST_00566 [Armillaria ostoyae]